MYRASPVTVSAFAALSVFLPSLVFAFPFGGQTSTVVPCYNQAIFARVGAPRGGDYIWTPATKTYQFGPPSFSGQWLLGLASAPYYCVVSIEPVIVWSGIAIDMMGSSGSSANTIGQLLGSGPASTAAPPATGTYTAPSTTPTPASTRPTTIGHVVINEVYYNVDTAHGSKPLNQWVELVNASPGYVDVSGWKLQNSSTQTALPQGLSLSPGDVVLVVATSSTTHYWTVPGDAKIASLNAQSIDGGLSTVADALMLKKADGTVVDAVSWGTNTSVFNPPVAASLTGYSLSRKGLSSDTDQAADWNGSTVPYPGK